MNTLDPKYHQKSKAISSAEPNYFVHFAMRHTVVQNFVHIDLTCDELRGNASPI